MLDMDELPGSGLDSRLRRFDAVYLTGGDPTVFMGDLERTGLSSVLRSVADSRTLLIGASGGSMQFCQSVALFRLNADGLAATLASLPDCRAMGLVDYELLPHLDRLHDDFIEQVRLYSEHISHDIVALRDGVAVMHDDSDERIPIGGDLVTFRSGNVVR